MRDLFCILEIHAISMFFILQFLLSPFHFMKFAI